MLDHPNNLDTANELTRQGEFEKAEEIYQALIASDPLNADALFHFGFLCMKKDRPDLALDFLSKALAARPNDPNIFVSLSFAHYSIGNIQQAVASLTQAIFLDPDSAGLEDLKVRYLKTPHTQLAGALQGCHSPERQVFMSATVDLLKTTPSPLRILEIGSFAGMSALTWANAADALYRQPCSIMCIDQWGNAGADEYTESIGASLRSNAAYNIFRHNISLVPATVIVDHIRATSEATLPSLQAGHFDIIYIDGCHFFKETLNDIAGAHRLLKPGGMMCGDDLEIQATNCDRAVAEQHVRDDLIVDPKSGMHFHPGVTLAVDAYFGKVSAYGGFWIMQKTETSYDPVSFKNATGILPIHWPAEYTEKIEKYFATSDELGELRQF